MTDDFRGRVALVTGAASGMGLATARAFARAGAAVALADIAGDAARAAAEDLVRAGGQAIGLACDVADEDAVQAMVARTVAAFGRLDAAFNNAGVNAVAQDAADATGEEFDRVNDVNLRGVWACMNCRPVPPAEWQPRHWSEVTNSLARPPCAATQTES